MSDVYRSAASVLLLRPTEASGDYEILLLHKPRKNDAWQLPQGGVEAGESIVDAAMRELQEEAGLSDCTVLGESTCVYQYNFPAGFRRYRPDNVCGQRICFVLALAPDEGEVKVDGKEVDEYAWIGVEEVGKYVTRGEYAKLIGDLYQEAINLLKKG